MALSVPFILLFLGLIMHLKLLYYSVTCTLLSIIYFAIWLMIKQSRASLLKSNMVTSVPNTHPMEL